MPEHAPKYSDRERRQIIRLRNQGKTYQEIAEMLGRSARGIESQLLLLRKKQSKQNDTHSKIDMAARSRYPWTDKEVQRLRDLKGRGLSHGDIGKLLHRSRSAVQVKWSVIKSNKLRLNSFAILLCL